MLDGRREGKESSVKDKFKWEKKERSSKWKRPKRALVLRTRKRSRRVAKMSWPSNGGYHVRVPPFSPSRIGGGRAGHQGCCWGWEGKTWPLNKVATGEYHLESLLWVIVEVDTLTFFQLGRQEENAVENPEMAEWASWKRGTLKKNTPSKTTIVFTHFNVIQTHV